MLTGAGYRMDPGQRAVLVNSSVANNGQVPYYPVGDLYLVLETRDPAVARAAPPSRSAATRRTRWA